MRRDPQSAGGFYIRPWKKSKGIAYQVLLAIAFALFLIGCSQTADIPSQETAVSSTTPSIVETTPTPSRGQAVSLTTPIPTPAPNCSTPPPDALPVATEPSIDDFRIVNQFPHDATAFTQGLQFVDGEFIEGTGLYGLSKLRRVAVETGEVLQEVRLEPPFFGEGITVFNDRIYQITWREQTAFVYDLDNFELLQTFNYETEGWGLTGNGRCLIMSDGSSTLTFRDPDTFALLGQLNVYDQNGPIIRLNELEYVNGEIYANIWMQNRIARISPDTGQVLSWIILEELAAIVQPTNSDNVLNGIAYNPENGHLYFTGKRWPTLFEIALVSP